MATSVGCNLAMAYGVVATAPGASAPAKQTSGWGPFPPPTTSKEPKLARTIAPLAAFCCVTLFASLVTFWGLQFTLSHVAQAARSAPIKGAVRTSYTSTLAVTTPDALNAAKTVKVVPTTPPEATSPATMQSDDVAYTHTVGVESLRVRSGPNKTTPQVFALKGGSKVRAVREDKGWILIDAGGRMGWVYNKLLRKAQPTLQAQL